MTTIAIALTLLIAGPFCFWLGRCTAHWQLLAVLLAFTVGCSSSESIFRDRYVLTDGEVVEFTVYRTAEGERGGKGQAISFKDGMTQLHADKLGGRKVKSHIRYFPDGTETDWGGDE